MNEIQMNETLKAKFWKYVNRLSAAECWNWNGALNEPSPNGYGSFYDGFRIVKAHRVSWIINRGAIPSGLLVLHKCDNRPCVNPDHLFVGTHRDNLLDASQKGRLYRGGNHLIGEKHPFAVLNTAKVIEIRKLAAQGLTPQQIASQFGVCRRAVWDVVNGHTWKHVQQ